MCVKNHTVILNCKLEIKSRPSSMHFYFVYKITVDITTHYIIMYSLQCRNSDYVNKLKYMGHNNTCRLESLSDVNDLIFWHKEST